MAGPVAAADLPPLHGVVPILVTPFDEAGEVDVESLRRLVDFTLDAGVHGLGIALGSEVSKLSDDERDLVARTVVRQAAGRVPVMMNTGAAATRLAVAHSRRAVDAGVDAVLCTAPGAGLPASALLDYFGSIAAAAPVPVIVQDTSQDHVAPAVLRTLAEQVDGVRYAKVESAPPVQRVHDAVRACDGLLGIFGGAGGGGLLQELRRGSIGTMPWPSTPRAFVEVWDRWHAGDPAGAREIFDRKITPVNRLAAGSLGVGHAVHKELLRRQGVIRCADVRSPAAGPDPITWEELAQTCAQLGIADETRGSVR